MECPCHSRFRLLVNSRSPVRGHQESIVWDAAIPADMGIPLHSAHSHEGTNHTYATSISILHAHFEEVKGDLFQIKLTHNSNWATPSEPFCNTLNVFPAVQHRVPRAGN